MAVHSYHFPTTKGAGGFRIMLAQLAYVCIALTCCAVSARATALFIVLTSDEIIVGTDSKITTTSEGTGEIIASASSRPACKIFQVGNVYVTHSGRFFASNSKGTVTFDELASKIRTGVEEITVGSVAAFLSIEFRKHMNLHSQGAAMNGAVFAIEKGRPVVARIVILSDPTQVPKITIFPDALSTKEFTGNQRLMMPMGSAAVYGEYMTQFIFSEVKSPEATVRELLAAEIGAAIERKRRGAQPDISGPISLFKLSASSGGSWIEKGACTWEPER